MWRPCCLRSYKPFPPPSINTTSSSSLILSPSLSPRTAFGEPKVVCVRTAETAEDVEEVILALRNTTGRKVKPLRKPVISRLPSVQVRREGWGGREGTEGRREGKTKNGRRVLDDVPSFDSMYVTRFLTHE